MGIPICSIGDTAVLMGSSLQIGSFRPHSHCCVFIKVQYNNMLCVPILRCNQQTSAPNNSKETLDRYISGPVSLGSHLCSAIWLRFLVQFQYDLDTAVILSLFLEISSERRYSLLKQKGTGIALFLNTYGFSMQFPLDTMKMKIVLYRTKHAQDSF